MFRKPTRAEIFLELFEQWRKHFKLPPIESRKDSRYHCHACIERWLENDNYHCKGYTELVYNARKLAKWDYYLLVNCALHEIGHYKHNLPYNTVKQQILSEYKAERFAVDMMKKYYPNELKKVIEYVKTKNMNKKKWQKQYPIHYAAYLKIKEYL
jgi:hypothetical protein